MVIEILSARIDRWPLGMKAHESFAQLTQRFETSDRAPSAITRRASLKFFGIDRIPRTMRKRTDVGRIDHTKRIAVFAFRGTRVESVEPSLAGAIAVLQKRADALLKWSTLNLVSV